MFGPENQTEDDETPQRLVQERRVKRLERRVPRRTVGRVDLETPRQPRRPAEELLVEVVAPPTDGLRDDDTGRDGVEQDEGGQPATARHDDDGERAPRDGAPDREAALPDLDRADDASGLPVVAGEQVVHA